MDSQHKVHYGTVVIWIVITQPVHSGTILCG